MKFLLFLLKIIPILTLSLLAVAFLVFLCAELGAFAGRAPTDLGVRDGRLKPPSNTRNSASSQANLYPDHPQQGYAMLEPFPLQPPDAAASLQTVADVLRGMAGLRTLC